MDFGDILAELDDLPGSAPKRTPASTSAFNAPQHAHSLPQQPSLNSLTSHVRTPSVPGPHQSSSQQGRGHSKLQDSMPGALRSSIDDLLDNLVCC